MLKLARSSSTVGVAAASMHKLYKTIENEVEEPLQGTVKGSIPVWIKGSLYRNGPGMFEVGEHKFKHWFDGMSMLQRFHISDGKVTYQRKFLRSDTFLNNTTSGRITINEFATAASPDPCKNIFQRFLTIFETDDMTDNTLVNVFPLKDELYTTTEIKYLNKIDPETLDRTEKVDLLEKVGANLSTAHPHWDEGGNMYNIGHSFKRGLFTVLTKVPAKKGYPEIKNRFRIVDRKTGEEINADHVIESDAFLYFHQINAYEEQGHIIVDISCHEDTKVLERFYMKNLTSKEYEENLKNVKEPEPRRYVIPLDLGKEEKGGDMVSLEHTTSKCKKIDEKTFHLQPEILADIGLEFPQINYRKYNTKKYRYIYGVAFRHKKNPLTTLAKVDVSTKKYIEWEEDKCYPSEPVFVPKPGGASEDDGVLVAAVNRVGEGDDDNSCFLLVLDAKSFTEIARVEFEGIARFPYDFHGVYADDKSLKKT